MAKKKFKQEMHERGVKLAAKADAKHERLLSGRIRNPSIQRAIRTTEDGVPYKGGFVHGLIPAETYRVAVKVYKDNRCAYDSPECQYADKVIDPKTNKVVDRTEAWTDMLTTDIIKSSIQWAVDKELALGAIKSGAGDLTVMQILVGRRTEFTPHAKEEPIKKVSEEPEVQV